jgi:competence protein ComEC
MSGKWIASVASVGLVAAPGLMKFAEVAAARPSTAPAEARSESQCIAAGGAQVERRFGGDKDIAAKLLQGTEVEVLETRGASSRIAYAVADKPRVGWVESRTLTDCDSEPVALGPTETDSDSHAHSAGTTHGDLSDSGPDVHVHGIDVGQGAATLFEFSCGAVLIDTGGETNGLFDSKNALNAYLDEFFDRRQDLNRTLDLVVITHPHIDHARNARMVAETYTVKNVVTDGRTDSSGGRAQKWLQDWAKTSAHFEAIDAAAIPAGGRTSPIVDPIQCPDEDPKIQVLWGDVKTQPAGWSSEAFGNANNKSVVVRLDFGRSSFLVTGDLEEEGIESLLEKHHGTKALDVNVLQVGHHGSHNATTQPLLAAVTPELALLATGDPTRQQAWTAWKYGHPRKTAVDLLSTAVTRARPAVQAPVATGAKHFVRQRITKGIYATGWDGSVVLTARNDGTMSVRTEK